MVGYMYVNSGSVGLLLNVAMQQFYDNLSYNEKLALTLTCRNNELFMLMGVEG